MARRIANPFQAQTPIGNAIAGLGEAIFGGRLSPSEVQKQQLETELFRAKVNNTQQETRDLQAASTSRNNLAGIMERAARARGNAVAPALQPGAVGPFQPATLDAQRAAFQRETQGLDFAKQAVGLASNPKEAFQAFLGGTANTPGATDNEVVRALAGTGTTLGKDASVSIGGQDRVRAANAGNEEALALARIGATPLSKSQVEGQALAQLPLPEQQERLGAPLSVVRGGLLADAITADDAGQPVSELRERGAFGAQAPILDPTIQVRDAGGTVREVPRGVANTPDNTAAFKQFGAAAPKASRTTADISPLSAANETKVENSAIEMGKFNIVMDDLEQIATAPGAETFFGIAGNVRRAAQGARGQLSALEQTLGGDRLGEITAELTDAAQREGKVFDANLANIDRVALLAAYQAASSLANQSGRALSDQDFRKFRLILGDPTAWLSNQATFVAGIRKMRSLATRLMDVQHRAFVGGIDAIAGNPPGDADAGGGSTENVLHFDVQGNRVQ